jgi:hypothetical protein
VRKFYILLFLLFISFDICVAQYLNVMISNINNPNEVSIMIDPKNPNRIVAGANAFYTNSYSGIYYSTNAGLNWISGIIQSTLTMPYGDPVIIVDTSGSFYYIQNSRYQNQWDRQLVCKSTNGGANWSNGVTYGLNGTKMQDKPWGCVDLTHSAYGNNIYITWTEFDNYMSYNPLDSSRIMFVRSTDGGLTFSTPKRISRFGGDAVDSSNTVEGAVPCVGPNGELYVSWAGPLGILFNKSTNGGTTWMSNESIATPAYLGGACFNIPGIYRCNGYPVIGCDISNSPYRGTIYINWSDQRNGSTDTDVWLIKSTNGGTSWSSPKRVNNDPPGKHQFFNWISIDKVTGYLYVIFYDRRNYATSSYTTDVYIARSTNGGATFDNVKINSTSFVPTPYVFFGDYNGISAYNNKVRPIWTRMDGNTNSIWTAIIDSLTIDIRKIDEKIPSSYSLKQNYPNPFNPKTDIKFDLSKSGKVKLSVFDIRGKELKLLINENLSAGKYETSFDASNYSSGIYFYKLEIENYSDTKKMVFLK